MRKTFTELNLQNRLLKVADFKLFSSMKSTNLPDADSEYSKKLFMEADKILNADIPFIPVSLYMEFKRTGNRRNFENMQFDRRKALKALLLAEEIGKTGKYTNKIIDYTWAFMEETGWAFPASNLKPGDDIDSDDRANMPYCYKDAPWYIDLNAAEVGALLAMVYYYMQEELLKADAETLVQRIYYELDRRILSPFLATDDIWWMGFTGKMVNNWNPWILSNILTITAVCEKSDERRQEIVNKACRCIDNFISEYLDDGGCNEGSTYWFHAGGCLFDCLEILDEMTDGGVGELFKDPLIYNITSYIQKVHINDLYYLTYGDASGKLHADAKLLRRIGRRFKNRLMTGFGQELLTSYPDNNDEIEIPLNNTIRFLRNLMDTEDAEISYTPDLVSALPDTEICVFRQEKDSKNGFTVWVKGGHNAESHNHNDLGSIGLYDNGEPVLIDIGIGTYVKDTFTSKRYTLFPIRSEDHNIPLINGKGQLNGRQYHTDFFKIDSDYRTASVGLKNAYENKDEIKKYVRTVSLSDSCFVITDEIELYSNGDVVSNFYSYHKPELLTDGKIKLTDSIIMNYSADVTPEFKQIDFADTKFIDSWNTKCIYKLSFISNKTKQLKTQYTFLKIHKNGEYI